MLMMGCSFLVCSFSDFSTCAHIIFLRSSSKNRSSHKRYVLSFYDDMIRELSILMRDTYINFEWLVNMTLRTRKRIIIFSSTLVHLLLYSFKSSSNPHYETNHFGQLIFTLELSLSSLFTHLTSTMYWLSIHFNIHTNER